jgi:hypothetical protein
MTFSSTITGKTVMGSVVKAWGTWTNPTGTSGGDIETGLSTVQSFNISLKGSGVMAQNWPSINETFPLASGLVTIVTVAGATEAQAGYWEAIGME